MPGKKLDGLTPEELIAEARTGGTTRPASWRLAVGGRYDGDMLTMESEMEDGSVISAVFTIGADGIVETQYTFTSPKGRGVTEGMPWVRRTAGKDVEKAFLSHLYNANNWLGLSDEFRAGLRPRRPGRRGIPTADLALLVQRYLDACDTGPEPVEQLLTHAYAGETKNAINARLRRAVDLGLMTDRPGRGRAGGTMTDKCKRVLAGEEV